MANAVDTIVTHIRSGAQVLRIVSFEESRVMTTLNAVVRKINEAEKTSSMSLASWDIDTGYNMGPKDNQKNLKPKDPLNAIRAITDQIPDTPFGKKGDYLIVLKDFHPFLKEPVVQRAFRNRREANSFNTSSFRRPVILVTPSMMLPPEIKRSIIDIDFSLPDDQDLERTFEYVRNCLSKAAQQCEDSIKKRIIISMRGMTEPEAEEALFYAVYTYKGFTADCADLIEDEKSKVLKSSGVLTYVSKSSIASEASIGGYNSFKDFIKVRGKLYSDKARELKLPLPKGVVLLGPPGTGKTTVGEIAAKILNLPLVKMDFGSVFDSLVGESEAKMKLTLQQVTSLGGAVLLIDDADKAFRNITKSAGGDSGVSQRVFQQFLVWRSEYKGPVFTILTMNTTEGIPAELLRKGRFDEIFCSLLPNNNDRKNIIKIKLANRNIGSGLTEKQLNQLVDQSRDFTGAEIEGAVNEATYLAFFLRDEVEPTFKELLEALKSTIPVSKRDSQVVNEIIEYCKNNQLRSVNEEEISNSFDISTKEQRSVILN